MSVKAPFRLWMRIWNLSDYLKKEKISINYAGCDVMDNFLITAEQYPDKRFFKIEMGELIEEKSILLASGVIFFIQKKKLNTEIVLILNLFSTNKVLSLTSYLHL